MNVNIMINTFMYKSDKSSTNNLEFGDGNMTSDGHTDICNRISVKNKIDNY